MKRIFQLAIFALAASLLGCAVHDGHEDEPAPFWWPNFLYHASTHPTTEEYEQATGAAPAVADANATASARDVRTDWNPVYAEHPVATVAVPDALTHAVQTKSSAAATLYPNRGQAALAANSATLYPPMNEFSGGPAGSVSLLPRGPLAPTGYLGR